VSDLQRAGEQHPLSGAIGVAEAVTPPTVVRHEMAGLGGGRMFLYCRPLPKGVAVELAETMAFATLSSSGLLRAFTERSERYGLHRFELLTNKSMLYSVGLSLILLLLAIHIPLLQPIFGMGPLTVQE
jgi:magnesium-transporting ATPase (P-type)